MRDYFAGKTVLVTGASSGIGAALVRRLAPLGVRLLLVARSNDRLDALAEEARAAGSDAAALPADLSDPDGLRALLDALGEAGPRVDVLVNNAGVGFGGAFDAQPPAALDAMLRLNVGSLAALTAALWPRLPAGGGLLNVASTAAFQPVPGMTAYAATKAFVLSFTEGLHAEAAADPRRLHVTALCPGPTATRFFDVASMDASKLRGAMMDADAVAEAGLRGLAAGTRVVVPGVLNRVGAAGAPFVPRALLLPALRRAFGRAGRR